MNRIKELRTIAGFSMGALAERAHTTAPTINKLEKGQRKLTTEWMERLSTALGCEPADLIVDRSLDPNESRLLEAYHAMSAENRAMLLNFAELAANADAPSPTTDNVNSKRLKAAS